jgi:hypothetical protein
LNAEGFAPINPGKKFNREIARKRLLKLGFHGEKNDDSLLAPGEWWVRDLADEVESSRLFCAHGGTAWVRLRGVPHFALARRPAHLRLALRVNFASLKRSS